MSQNLTKKHLSTRFGQVLVPLLASALVTPASAQVAYDLGDFPFNVLDGVEVHATLETSVTGTFTTEAEIENFLNSSRYTVLLLQGGAAVIDLNNTNSTWDLRYAALSGDTSDVTATLTVTATEITLDFSTPSEITALTLQLGEPGNLLQYYQINNVSDMNGVNIEKDPAFAANRFAQLAYDESFVFPALQFDTPEISFPTLTGGVSATGGQLKYSGHPTGWLNNRAESINLPSIGVKDHFEVRFSIDSDPSESLWVVGLGSDRRRWQTIDHAIRNGNGQMMVYERGNWKKTGPVLAQGDTVSIFVNGDRLEYAHNGQMVYLSSELSTSDIVATFKEGPASIGATLQLKGPLFPGYTAIENWVNVTGGITTPNGNILYSGSPTGWVNSINSVPLSTLGASSDYQVDWVLFPYTNYGTWVVGLGVEETGSNWRDIDYGFRNSNGQISIYENGQYIKEAGVLSFDGDTMAIEVVGKQLNYYFPTRSQLIRSTTILGTEDFYIDTAFKEGEAHLIDFALRNRDVAPPPAGTPIVDWPYTAGGVSGSGNAISYSGAPTGWVNSINSVTLASLGAGPAYKLSWRIENDPSNSLWVVGLGAADDGNGWRGIDVALRNANGTLHVYIGGRYRTTLGTISEGDRLVIDATSNCYQFGINDTRSSTICNNGEFDFDNFYIDTAFKYGAADLGEFTLTRR